MNKILGMLLILLSGGAWGQAQNAWWHSVASNVAKNDGSVTLTDLNGNPVNVVANPTAAVVKPNQAAVTQPPTVIVQATTGYWKDPVASWASLPTTGNSVGDARMVTALGLAFTWNGSAWTPLAADQNGNMSAQTFTPTLIATANQPCSTPSQIASSGTGPLFCQSGMWAEGGSGVYTPMYLEAGGSNPATCPAGWSQADFQYVYPGTTNAASLNYRRTCLPPSKTCSVVYLDHADGSSPAPHCPAGWTSADYEGIYSAGNLIVNDRLTCFIC